MSATRELFFSAPSRDKAAALAAALQQAGYLVPEEPDHVPADPALDDEEYYEITAYAGYSGMDAPRDTVLAEMAKMREDTERLAEEHGCQWAGSGEFIGPLDLLADLGES